MIDELVKALNLVPLPEEGGLYAETWRSGVTLPAENLPAPYGGPRMAGTAIYFLLTAEPGCFSALHAVAGDEIFHFYLADPVEMLLLHPDGRHELVTLGPDVLGGQRVQFVVPGGVWQGCRLAPGGRYALMGTTMAPGFDPADFTLGRRADLSALYPAAESLINLLTRE